MSEFVLDKKIISEKVLSLINKTEFYNDSNKWWTNHRNGGGLALTAAGNEAFILAGLEYWDSIIKDTNLSDGLLYLLLDRKLPCPYFLMIKRKVRILRVWDSRIAVTLTLWDNIEEYLKSLDNRKNIKSIKHR